jgi:hypothetical protein
MNSKHRWTLFVILPLILAVVAGLSRTHATTTATDSVVARIAQSATISAAPGRVDAENTFIVTGIQATAVRILSRSLDMNMGIIPYMAKPLDSGRWRIVNVEVPMVGRWGVEVQARHNRAWMTVGEVAYYVPFTGRMHLLDHRLISPVS